MYGGPLEVIACYQVNRYRICASVRNACHVNAPIRDICPRLHQELNDFEMTGSGCMVKGSVPGSILVEVIRPRI